ncbi:hypothetical protein [Pandoraea iniqua]|uniref:hypothetical protein n=1 Tax=Pandoraea iniqua TaxID=2508288 RepID=UPI001240A0BA|nr:hypothetical protein [Pandoraea iniqua]
MIDLACLNDLVGPSSAPDIGIQALLIMRPAVLGDKRRPAAIPEDFLQAVNRETGRTLQFAPHRSLSQSG